MIKGLKTFSVLIILFFIIYIIFCSNILFAQVLFKDIDNHWAKETIEWGIKKGIVKGYSSSFFQPNNYVTEEEFLALLIRTFYGNLDINNTNWSDNYYILAKEKNYPLLGLNNLDKRKSIIKRRQVAELISGVDGVNYLGDNAIQYLLAKGLAKGKIVGDISIKSFMGDDYLTRAEALKFIKNALDNGLYELKKRPLNPSSLNILQNIKTPLVTSYRIFYGEPTSDIINELKKSNLVIIEPHFYNQEMIKEIKSSGTLAFGYLSTMEADTWNKDFFSKLNKEDFYYRNGARIYFPEWDSYLVDFTSKHYTDLLLKEIKEQIINKGMHGIFLDTVGDIDDQFNSNPTEMKKQQLAMQNFLQQIKDAYPELLLIQNWGFDTLKNYTSPYLYGFMWEDFEYAKIINDDWSLEKIKEIDSLKEKYNLQVFTVSFEEKEKSLEFANKHHFVHLYTDLSYDKW